MNDSFDGVHHIRCLSSSSSSMLYNLWMNTVWRPLVFVGRIVVSFLDFAGSEVPVDGVTGVSWDLDESLRCPFEGFCAFESVLSLGFTTV